MNSVARPSTVRRKIPFRPAGCSGSRCSRVDRLYIKRLGSDGCDGVNGSSSVADGNRLTKHGGKIIDIAPTKTKFPRALVSRSREAVFVEVEADNLQQVVDLAAARKSVVAVARSISLAGAPALMTSLGQGKRLNGKAIIVFALQVLEV